jgi:multidrug efflux pump subunit AcrA (membrane-fusion protein)
VLEQAIQELQAADARLRQLKNRQGSIASEMASAEGKVEALRRQLSLLVNETGELESAKARLQLAESHLESANAELDQAKLNRSRMDIRAPIAGKVLEVLALPGSRVTGLDSGDSQGSGTLVEMYDPASLQVRADVRLEDVAKVQPGQRAEIRTPSSPEVLHGEVLQVTSAANVQKNTLEVKIRLLDPPESVRPEMLVTATFLSQEVEEPAEPGESVAVMLVPEDLLTAENGNPSVWVANAANRAQRKSVTLAGPVTDGMAAVTGLDPADKLIATSDGELSEGAPIRIRD